MCLSRLPLAWMARVSGWRAWTGVGDHRQRLVFDFDQVQGLGGDLARLGGHDRHRIAHVAHRARPPRPARPVEDHQPVVVLAGDILGGQHGGHARQRAGLADIQAASRPRWDHGAFDPRVQHALESQIVGVDRRAGDLGDGIRALGCDRAHHPAQRGSRRQSEAARPAARCASTFAAAWMAPMMVG